MSKRKITSEHLMGKVTRNGYSKEGDTYFISPSNASIMQAIQDEYEALNAYIAAINSYVVPRFGALAKRRSEWWENMKADVESTLDGYEFNTGDRSLRPVVKKSDGAK